MTEDDAIRLCTLVARVTELEKQVRAARVESCALLMRADRDEGDDLARRVERAVCDDLVKKPDKPVGMTVMNNTGLGDTLMHVRVDTREDAMRPSSTTTLIWHGEDVRPACDTALLGRYGTSPNIFYRVLWYTDGVWRSSFNNKEPAPRMWAYLL